MIPAQFLVAHGIPPAPVTRPTATVYYHAGAPPPRYAPFVVPGTCLAIWVKGTTYAVWCDS